MLDGRRCLHVFVHGCTPALPRLCRCVRRAARKRRLPRLSRRSDSCAASRGGTPRILSSRREPTCLLRTVPARTLFPAAALRLVGTPRALVFAAGRGTGKPGDKREQGLKRIAAPCRTSLRAALAFSRRRARARRRREKRRHRGWRAWRKRAYQWHHINSDGP